MPCHPHVDSDTYDALNLALCTLADRRCALHWGDPAEHIALLASLILEANSQLTLKIQQALDQGYNWNQIRDRLGTPDPHGRR
ncbi:MAG: hypothetical protein M3O70_02920 [Actinomycetota bacterium]|nr:hypothetical protein [Actinomycetota bacterium]